MGKFTNALLATAFLAVFFCQTNSKADVVILQSGVVVPCKIIQQDWQGVLIQKGYDTFHYPTNWIKDIKKDTNDVAASDSQRIPDWTKIISTLATNEWATGIKQIPATVIGNGILQNVPYVSFRCKSGGYEINIYGDLDKPAGVEIGAINYLVHDEEAKANCVNFISSLLDSKDTAIVHSLNIQQKGLRKDSGMTFETTFPDEPDAYGGWWVSVYDETALTNARASGDELLSITQPRIVTNSPPSVVYSSPPVATTEPQQTWSSYDMSYSRPSSSSYSSGGGSVYVHGYYRKNGTYVNSYYRSAPHRH